jgi:hypothetical protein
MSFLLILVATGVSGSTMAQDLLCTQSITWRGATYAQRTTNIEGQLIRAEIESFSNVWFAQINEGPERAAIISVKEKFGGDAITLTFGKDRPKPSDFSEIGMAVEPPMGDGNWPRMKNPCDVKDGSVVEFNENEMDVATGENSMKTPRFRGVLRRKSMRFSYSIEFEANGTDQAMSWQGELNYGSATKIFNMATDVQGWHLYRAGTFVKTMPIGKTVDLSTVLNELGVSSL